jgi:hypothetical protein
MSKFLDVMAFCSTYHDEDDKKVKAAEAERDAPLAQELVHTKAPAGMLLKLRASAPIRRHVVTQSSDPRCPG